MKFAVHTDKGVFYVDAKNPKEAREVDCEPFQAMFWVGVRVEASRALKVGGLVQYHRPDGMPSRVIRYPIAAIEPDLTPEQFSSRYPVGTPCRYYPIAGDREHIKTRTRSDAWALGHGAMVVKIEGLTGGVDINHLVMEATS